MGRILSRVRVQNIIEPDKYIDFDALVDTGSAYLVLPESWKLKLGNLNKMREVWVQLADHTEKSCEIYGPIRIEIAGFAPICGEVLFMNEDNAEGQLEPLVGYIPLEQAQIAVDMVGHRLLAVKTVDLKHTLCANNC